MTPKTPGATMNAEVRGEKPVIGAPGASDFAAQWAEARLVYPLYAGLATQFNLAPLPYPPGELPPARPTRSMFDQLLLWLVAIDSAVLAYQMRQLPPEILNASEASLRALIQRQLRKADKTEADRDKIDLLLVQYFAMCAPEQLYRKEITLDDVARTLQPVLTEADATPLEWCEPLEKILDKLEHCHSLRDLLEDGLMEQGRLLKDSAGCMFYDPAALVAFCRFNFLLRRAFIRMLHADLKAVREAIESLNTRGIKTVDCRGAGFSAAETPMQLRFFCENWRQPFQKDYTESSVTHSLEQLLALRADVEDALARAQSDTGAQSIAPPIVPALIAQPAPEPAKPLSEHEQPAQAPAVSATPTAPAKTAEPAADAPASSADALNPEKCLETIWEQLIAAPPARGRSMSTVVLQDTKVLLSSWEVAAFVSEGGQESEDLRRAVVARALLAVATDRRKHSGDESALTSALALSRNEVSYFHGRIEQAKRSKNTEAAVNLGISTKRLLSFMEEAEKLRS
ncbi:MAG: hypothetical protein ABSE45_00705 [Candidatus Acidiferrales bacterium]|jgi:hypothetical protein